MCVLLPFNTFLFDDVLLLCVITVYDPNKASISFASGGGAALFIFDQPICNIFICWGMVVGCLLRVNSTVSQRSTA